MKISLLFPELGSINLFSIWCMVSKSSSKTRYGIIQTKLEMEISKQEMELFLWLLFRTPYMLQLFLSHLARKKCLEWLQNIFRWKILVQIQNFHFTFHIFPSYWICLNHSKVIKEQEIELLGVFMVGRNICQFLSSLWQWNMFQTKLWLNQIMLIPSCFVVGLVFLQLFYRK